MFRTSGKFPIIGDSSSSDNQFYKRIKLQSYDVLEMRSFIQGITSFRYQMQKEEIYKKHKNGNRNDSCAVIIILVISAYFQVNNLL